MTSEAAGKPREEQSSRLGLVITTVFLCLALLSAPASAQQPRAYITLQKSPPPENMMRYQVKPGDTLGAILQAELGGVHRNLKSVRELNPHIRDLHRIYPGQIINLPRTVPHKTKRQEEDHYHLVARGETLSSILRRKLNLTGAALQEALQRTIAINPALKNPHQIYPGQKILLPAVKGPAPTSASEPCTPRICEAQETAADTSLPLAETIAILEAVLERMGAKIITDGTYHLPLAGIGNFTIDNSLIPQIEFACGSVAILDFHRRIPEYIRDGMTQNWPGLALVTLNDAPTIPRILENIFSQKRSYQFQKLVQPLSIGSPAQVEIQADFVIGWPGTKESPPGRQALIFLKDRAQQLPPHIRLFAQKAGVIITEITAGRVLPKDAPLPDEFGPPTRLQAGSNLELIRNLLNVIGLKPQEGWELPLFELAQDGFKLSFTADLLVSAGERRVIFHRHPLPPPFVSRLAEKGYQFTLVGNETGRGETIKRTLNALPWPFSTGLFRFSLPGRPDGPINTVSFPAIRVEQSQGNLYLIDFELEEHLHAWLKSQWRLNLIKY